MPLILGAGLADVIISIAILLIVFALAYLLLEPLRRILSAVPVIGGAIFTAIGKAERSIVDWGVAVAKAGLDPIVQFIFSHPHKSEQAISEGVAATEQVAGYVDRVASMAGGAIGTTASRLSSADARSKINAYEIGRTATEVAAHDDLLNAILTAVVPAAAAGAVAASKGFTEVEVRSEATARDKADAQVKATAAAAIDAEAQLRAKGDANSAAHLAAEVAALQAAIAGAQALERGYTDRRTAELEGEIGNLGDVAIPAALATALAAARAVATDLARTKAECVDPVCSTFGTQAGLWASLMTGAELGLLFELISTAVRDPQAAAVELNDGVGVLRGMAAPILSVAGVGS